MAATIDTESRLQGIRSHARQIALCVVDTHWRQESLQQGLAALWEKQQGPDPARAARYLIDCNPLRSPSVEQLIDQLLEHEPLARWLRGRPALSLSPGRQTMQATPQNLMTLPLPAIPHKRHLAQWLGLEDNELDWFVDLGRRERPGAAEALHHYRYRCIERPGRGPRLLEIPKARLKSLQRQILQDLLYRVPVHPDAHGFCRRRSCVSAAEPHCGQDVLLRLDLQDYFHSIDYPRVRGLFLMLGYPHDVATALAGLCCHRTPSTLLAQLPAAQRQSLRARHLPQGAPSSPYLANLCSWRLDRRLDGLAGARGLRYSRYADDIALSGSRELAESNDYLQQLIGAIALEEGFRLNYRKTRCMTQSGRQKFCGIVVNRHPNPARPEFDRLKAILHNCLRHGASAQNREGHANFRAHLAGRIAHIGMLNPQRGRRLKSLWQQIDWDE